jgi:hypothetical protein
MALCLPAMQQELEKQAPPRAGRAAVLSRAAPTHYAPADTQLTQQELPACKPVLDATWVRAHAACFPTASCCAVHAPPCDGSRR